MCGIFGVFNYNYSEQVDKNKLIESTRLLKHRGPDGEGFYLDEKLQVGFGHRRLSIIDLVTGDQPMCNEDGTIWIVFNGEIYNFLELKAELKNRGHKFKTKSDTEVIIHAYEEYGEKFPKKLNGIFAFAIWDSKKKRIYLARDHFGVKPLYFYKDNSCFIFSSEIKSIINYAKHRISIDEQSLYECLTLRYIIAPNTLFAQIYKVPPSSCLIFENDKYHIFRYYDKKIVVDYDKPLKYWQEKLENDIETAVKRQMISDVPIGVSLSGGLDSGTILALMTKHIGEGVHSFTVGFEGNNDEDNEIEKARRLSEIYGAEFNSYVITENDYINFFEKYILHLEEPVGNESAIAYYFVAELANGKVKVLLNGQGADEPFGGYDRYLGFYYLEKFPFLLSLISKFFIHLKPDLTRKKQFEKIIDLFNAKKNNDKLMLANQLLTNRFQNEIFKVNFLNEKINIVKSKISDLISHRIIGNNTEKLFYYDLFTSLPENLLLSEDKMAMAASIEARVPFLDIDLIETALSIPAKYKIGLLSGKKILKEVCTKYLPRKIVHQRKIGFNNPASKWFINSLGEMFLDYINSNDSVTKNYLRFDNVMKLYNEHKNLEENHEKILFLLLSLEIWRNKFIG